MSNIPPASNDDKKTAKQNENGGSGKTEDNLQIEEERRETNVNDCNVQIPEEEGMGPGNGGNGPEDDTTSKMSKKSSDYVKFFKFYYDKTKTEHPNWTPSQITTIVSLLWKKKKSSEKTPSQAGSNTSRRSNKPLTGRDAFKLKHKELSKEEVEEMWNKLPNESKKFWKQEGNTYCNVSAKSSDVSSVRNCQNPLPIYNAFRALLNHM